MKRRFGILSAVLVLSLSAAASAETITVVNRTGRALEIIQAAPAGTDQWGDDLIPDRTILDGESAGLDLIGPSPWAFRMIDSAGEVYVLYDVTPALTGKITIRPENQARLSELAGGERTISLSNRTGSAIVSLRISASSDGVWGNDVLGGRSIRNGETADVELEATPGALSFDIRFTILVGNEEISYEKDSVILTDGASLVLTALPGSP